MAASAPFHGATWSAFATKDATGCSAGSTFKPHWSRLTGLGSIYATGHSRTCRGPSRVFGSSATISSQLQVTLPERFTVKSYGINVSWDLTGSLTTTGGVSGNTTCAPTRTNASFNLGYTWENYTSIAFSCYGLGTASIGGSAFLEDVTTGVQYGSSNSWSGVANSSGVELFSSASRYSYSNASYWSYNSSSSFSLNHSYGGNGAVSGSWYPTWFINGTYVPTDQYVLVTSVAVTCYTDTFGFARSFGSATGDMYNAPDQVQLSAISVW